MVLRFLATWHPPDALTLKQLTLKTVALIALTSSDRAQTLHALRVDRFSVTSQGLEFVIFEVLKKSVKLDLLWLSNVYLGMLRS